MKNGLNKGQEMKKPECYYYKDGYCNKALPSTPCEFKGCVAYTDHKPMTLAERKEEWLGKVEEHRKQVLKMALTWQDIAIILTIYEEGDYPKHGDASKMEVYSKEILKKFKEIKRK